MKTEYRVVIDNLAADGVGRMKTRATRKEAVQDHIEAVKSCRSAGIDAEIYIEYRQIQPFTPLERTRVKIERTQYRYAVVPTAKNKWRIKDSVTGEWMLLPEKWKHGGRVQYNATQDRNWIDAHVNYLNEKELG